MIPGTPTEVNILGRKDMPVMGGVAMSAGGFVIPEEEQQKLRFISQMFQSAAAFRSRYDKHWPRFWNLWESNHYWGKTVFTLTRAVINQIFSAVETYVGHVSDTLTPPNVYSRDLKNRDKAKLITKWLKTEWDRSGAEYELQHVVRSAAVTGVGWIELPWDWTLWNGRGGCGFVPKDERFMFTNPHCRELSEALYVIEASNVPREFVENGWERGKLVPPGVWMPQVSNSRIYTGGSPDMDGFAQFLTTDGSQSGVSTQNNSEGQDSKHLVTLLKCWIRQSDGKMKFIPVSNGLLLNPENEQSPYEDEQFPYVKLNLIPTLECGYGRSLVQFVEGLQEVLDNSLSYMLDVQRFTADPMLAVSGINLEQGHIIENMPGAILPDKSLMAGQGQGYYWLNGPGFNQSWMQILESVVSAMDSVLGRVDVLKGERPAGVNTLGGLEIIRDEANVRVRNLMRWVKSAVKQCHILMLSRLKQFVHDERSMRVTNKKGRDEYITVNPVVGQKIDGQPVQDQTIPEDAEFEFDFGPDEPGGEQAKREFVLTLATTPGEDGLPLVTRRWVLDKLDVQEKDELLQEIEQQKGMMAQAQQDAEAAKSGAGQAQEDPMSAISALFE